MSMLTVTGTLTTASSAEPTSQPFALVLTVGSDGSRPGYDAVAVDDWPVGQMACGVTDPVGCVTDVVHGATRSVADAAFSAIAHDFGVAADSVVNWLWRQISSADAVSLGGPGFDTELAITVAIAVPLGLGLFVIQVIVSVVRHQPGRLVRAGRGLRRAVGSAQRAHRGGRDRRPYRIRQLDAETRRWWRWCSPSLGSSSSSPSAWVCREVGPVSPVSRKPAQPPER